MRFVYVFLAVLVMFSTVSAEAVSKEANAAAEAMVNRFVNSWNRADGPAYGENYWPEAELVDPTGTVVEGRAAIVQEHVDLWNGIFKGSHATGRIRKVSMLGTNCMMVDFDVELSDVRQPPPGSPANSGHVLRNHLKHILEKRNGKWKVIAAQNTFIAPKPTP